MLQYIYISETLCFRREPVLKIARGLRFRKACASKIARPLRFRSAHGIKHRSDLALPLRQRCKTHVYRHIVCVTFQKK